MFRASQNLEKARPLPLCSGSRRHLHGSTHLATPITFEDAASNAAWSVAFVFPADRMRDLASPRRTCATKRTCQKRYLVHVLPPVRWNFRVEAAAGHFRHLSEPHYGGGIRIFARLDSATVARRSYFFTSTNSLTLPASATLRCPLTSDGRHGTSLSRRTSVPWPNGGRRSDRTSRSPTLRRSVATLLVDPRAPSCRRSRAPGAYRIRSLTSRILP